MRTILTKALIILSIPLIILYACKKEENYPILTTSVVSEITGAEAVCGGNITSDGGKAIIARGVCWSTNNNPTINDNKTVDGEGTGSFISNLTQLSPVTTYYVKAYATNSAGTGYGTTKSFITIGGIATATTDSVNNILATSATFNATVNANYLSTNITFEYGISIVYGKSINATQSPVTGNTNEIVTANIDGLLAGQIYHVRVKAVNDLGIVAGNDLSFTTKLSDIEGNIYKIVIIGSQVWMAENLKTTRYNDDTPIPNITSDSEWGVLTSPAYCWYNNDASTYKNPYGALYNWFTVNTGKLCPLGWHVPTDPELATLSNYLGGDGGKIKETGTSHWYSPNTGATNETGFTALPGGLCVPSGGFSDLGELGLWWSATELVNNTDLAKTMDLTNTSGILFRPSFYPKTSGLSIRCLRN